jgi:hypothetical protein
MAKAAGFHHPVLLQQSTIEVHDPEMRALLGNAQFFSITYRLFKLPGLLEPQCEDYGQVAIYKVTQLAVLPLQSHQEFADTWKK